QAYRRRNETTIVGSPALQWNWRVNVDEVRLGLAVTQRQLLHSFVNKVVSFICRYSVIELLYLFRLDPGKSHVSWE
ncbi:hypothetical protein HAX54_009364, partial [Datura stramonium]|nr:hypothetical protein [Datura stramonium]